MSAKRVIPRNEAHRRELEHKAWVRAQPGYRDKMNAWARNHYRKHEHVRHKKREYSKRWLALNPDKKLEHKLKHRYGITLEDYSRLLVSQGGVCLVCQKPPKAGKRLVIHHDHKTEQVVCLLHLYCNILIGIVGDSPAALRDIADRLDACYNQTSLLRAG